MGWFKSKQIRENQNNSQSLFISQPKHKGTVSHLGASSQQVLYPAAGDWFKKKKKPTSKGSVNNSNSSYLQVYFLLSDITDYFVSLKDITVLKKLNLIKKKSNINRESSGKKKKEPGTVVQTFNLSAEAEASRVMWVWSQSGVAGYPGRHSDTLSQKTKQKAKTLNEGWNQKEVKKWV